MPILSNFETKYIKALILGVLLFFESLAISTILYGFSKSGNYLNPNLDSLVTLLFLLLLTSYTYALTIGIWENRLQYLIVPLPLSLGIASVVAQVDILPALITLVVAYVLSAYDVYFATRMQNLLLKFEPNFVLKRSIKGILFIFAASAALLVLLNPKSAEQIDIAKELSKIVDTHLQSYLQNELGGLNGASGLNGDFLGLNFQDYIQGRIEKTISPYKQFILPILALISLGLIQFLSIFVGLTFLITIKPVFALAKKTGFFKVSVVSVNKEIISL